ncbi:MAG: DNA repair protein RadA [Myxococcota bacterium]
MKARRIYTCQACAHQQPKWLGRCPDCGAWSSFVEEMVKRDVGSAVGSAPPTSKARALSSIGDETVARIQTGIPELDRVLGGGLVPGALVLVGGDPGIGKSTLLLQAMGALCERGLRVLYVSAEESLSQIKLRADRLQICADNLFLLAETQMEAVDAAKREIEPQVCVIDSIQTVGVAELDSAVGSVSQIRGVTQRLMEQAKGAGISTFVVGHVTKEGAIAGPKVMEHMVDTVLYFEGERTGPYRILRAHKNRFGSAQEIGVFEMHGGGLRPVGNPSELFLSQRGHGPGTTVVTSVEGSRPLMLEVQALTTPSPYGTPRRTTLGFDQQRVAMLCAVLSARAGIELGALDVYVNITGGVKVTEPAADLGVIVALASAVSGEAIATDTVLIGEVGLSGEVRMVANLGARLTEAQSLGFERCIVPKVDFERLEVKPRGLMLVGVRSVREALEAVGQLKADLPG